MWELTARILFQFEELSSVKILFDTTVTKMYINDVKTSFTKQNKN